MKNDILKSLEILEEGKTILYPTDTVWGIGCDATDFSAVKQIYKIKEREESKSLVILVDSIQMLEKIIPNIPTKAFEFLQDERPTTLIYEHPKGLANNVIATDDTVAIRLVQDEFCQQLIQKFGKPIVSTSANISGEPTPSHFHEISEAIKKAVDYTVNWRQSDDTPKKASRIIKISPDNEITIIRA